MNYAESYVKNYAEVNGRVVDDKEIRSITNNNEQIIMGHDNNKPIYIKRIFGLKTPKSKRKRRSKSKSKSKRKK
jgi:hypothetical protein